MFLELNSSQNSSILMIIVIFLLTADIIDYEDNVNFVCFISVCYASWDLLPGHGTV